MKLFIPWFIYLVLMHQSRDYGAFTLSWLFIKNVRVEICHPQCMVFSVSLLSLASMTHCILRNASTFSCPVNESKLVPWWLYVRQPIIRVSFFTDQLNVDVQDWNSNLVHTVFIIRNQSNWILAWKITKNLLYVHG